MSLYSKFKTSSNLENDGIILDLGFAKITLARAGGNNQKYNAAIAQVAKKHGRALQNDLLASNRAIAILHEVFADTIVRDWQSRSGGTDDEPEYERGIENEAGEIIPFNRDNVIQTFRNLPDLFLEIKEASENIAYFRQSLIEETAKN